MALDAQTMDGIVRFLHILSGIIWIGHLYFFNLTNLPVFKFAINNGDPGQKGGPSLMLRALWWFRWGAMATLVFGFWLLYIRAHENPVNPSVMNFLSNTSEGHVIGLGIILAIIMWFNVWFIIWPAQKVVLGNNVRIAKGVTPDEKTTMEAQNAPLAKRAKMASRINFWASIPMLFFMVMSSHSSLFS